MKTWITLSVVALLPMLLRSPKALSPIRVSARDPSRLAGLFRRYSVQAVTGRASDVGKRSDSYTRGSIGSATPGAGQPPTTSGSIDTEVVVTDRLFLTGVDGRVTSFEDSGFDARIGNGHLVSLVRVLRGFPRSGRSVLIHNHTTGESFFKDDAIRKSLTFPYPSLYIGILCLMILPFPVVIFFGLAEAVQRARFKSAGVRPLIQALDEAARTAQAATSSAGATPTGAQRLEAP